MTTSEFLAWLFSTENSFAVGLTLAEVLFYPSRWCTPLSPPPPICELHLIRWGAWPTIHIYSLAAAAVLFIINCAVIWLAVWLFRNDHKDPFSLNR